jgi:hypothetical protein
MEQQPIMEHLPEEAACGTVSPSRSEIPTLSKEWILLYGKLPVGEANSPLLLAFSPHRMEYWGCTCRLPGSHGTFSILAEAVILFNMEHLPGGLE